MKKQLASMGWHTVTIWECELKATKREKTLESLAFTLNKIFLQDFRVKQYEIPEKKSMVAVEDISNDYKYD